jgi:hypothetical protein
VYFHNVTLCEIFWTTEKPSNTAVIMWQLKNLMLIQLSHILQLSCEVCAYGSKYDKLYNLQKSDLFKWSSNIKFKLQQSVHCNITATTFSIQFPVW